MPDIRCRLTKTDGTTITLCLPAKQAEAMANSDSPEGAAINDFLGVVAIEILAPDDGPSEPNS